MKAIILSGGLGTRLRPLTCTTPKALLPLLNRPFIEYQIDLLRKYGFKQVLFCLSYKPQRFIAYLKKLRISSYKLQIDYLVEKEPLGTGGAIKNAFLKENNTYRHSHRAEFNRSKEPVMVINGDLLIDIDLNRLISFHQKRQAKITVTLAAVENPTLFGLIKMDNTGRIISFTEKPSLKTRNYRLPIADYLVNAGIYMFEPEVIDYIPSQVNYSLEHGLFPLLLKKKLPLYGYIHDGYWLDIGTIEKYLQANFDLLNGKVKGARLKVKSRREKGKSVIGEKTNIDDSVQIIGNVVVGKNCSIRENAVLKDSLVLDNSYIGAGVRIENSVIGNNCRIEDNAILGPGNALADGSKVKKYSKL